MSEQQQIAKGASLGPQLEHLSVHSESGFLGALSIARTYSDEHLAFIAAGIAFVSLVVAYLSYRNSAKALGIAQVQEHRRSPKLIVTMEDGLAQRVDGKRQFLFLLTFSNQSDSDNSVSRLALHVLYHTDQAEGLRFEVPVSSNILANAVSPGDLLTLPSNINARHSIAGWVAFDLLDDLIDGIRIDSYVIVANDAHGDEYVVEVTVIREVVQNEEATKRDA